MKDKEVWKICLFVVVCILINYIGKMEAEKMNLPLWLDFIGTGLSAYFLGPICGAIIGATGNIIYGASNAASYAYIFTGAAIGITMGLCMKKGLMSSFFGAFTSSMIVAAVSTAISAPLNCLFFGGYTENIWGNGVFDMLRFYGVPVFVSSAVGEFCVDFLDKGLSVLLIYGIVKHKSFCRRKQDKAKLLNCFLCGILLTGGIVFGSAFLCKNIYADEILKCEDFYAPTFYNNADGLLGGTANDIAETSDGFLWIGTNDGLYRYDGAKFYKMSEFKCVKNVNCLFVDEESRLWIGTDDNGLSICVNENISNIVDSKSGLPGDSVRCIGNDSNGNYYVGTSKTLCVFSLDGGLKIIENMPNIICANSISSSENGYTSVVTNDGRIFLLKDLKILQEISIDNSYERYTCCMFDEKGLLYVGTSGNYIDCFDVSEGTFKQLRKIETGTLKNIESLTLCEDGKSWICSESGIGHLDREGNFHYVNIDNFSGLVNNMTMDYQENLWFASSESGLLKLCKSDFMDIYKQAGLEEVSVNAVTKWQDKIYFGTDDGLDIIDDSYNKIMENELIKRLEGKKIKYLKTDSLNHLWICPFEKNEIFEVYPNGQIFTYNEQTGISADRFYCIQELKDGTMAVSCDNGLIFIKDGKLLKTLKINNGISDLEILTIFEKEDGTLLAGTNGDGIAIIQNGSIVREIKKTDGLGSEAIFKIIPDENGVFLVTGSSVCYMDDSYNVRVLDKFPYYDNYDILDVGEDTLWILGGAGIYVADKNSLLYGGTSDYQLLNSKTGLNSFLTPNAQNYIDESGNIYLPCKKGCYFLNINEYNKKEQSYRIKVKYMNVDDSKYYVNRSDVTCFDRSAKIIEIVPVLLNYSLNDLYVRYYLEGFDNEPVIVSQSEMKNVVYTNLPSGEYTFHLEVLDSQKSKVVSAASYKIKKEMGFFENWWFKAYFVLICVLVIVWFSWFLTRLRLNKTIEEEKRKLAIAKKQTEMGNETIIAIAKTVDAKDGNTSQHSERVAEYSVMIAKKLGWDEERCENLRKTALLHDIGKIGIPDSVLNKPSRLTDEEYNLMKSHVEIGAEILKDFTIVESVADGARYHHERYDGKGYKKGLKGEEIPINARIIGIADAFDAMTSNRVYRKHLDMNYVIMEIKKGSGTQFDPKIANIMIELIIDGSIDISKLYDSETELETNV